MILILELIASPAGRAKDSARQVFGEDGGTIGRAGSNTWVLTHSQVSGRHAVISFKNGDFYIQDTSRNGVSVNSLDNRLVPNRPYPLKHGDRLFIEPYEITVRVEAGPGQSLRRTADDPFSQVDPFGQPLAPPLRSSAMDSGEVDPLKFFDPLNRPAAVRKPEAVVSPADDLLDAHYEPPAVVSSPIAAPPEPVAIPHGYNPLAPDDSGVSSVAPRPGPAAEPPRSDRRERAAVSRESPSRPEVVPPVEVSVEAVTPPAPTPPANAGAALGERSGADDLANLLAGAGLQGAVVTPELTRSIGQILRVVVSGLMDILQSRQRIKEEFRMRQTVFRAKDNNPIKFSANVDDALHNLLVKRNAAYLGPVDAFADAFEDLRNHQLAMLAGMRVAFDKMLAEFDPDLLQEQFDRQLSKVALPLVPAKLRYWDLFCERRRDMVKDPEAAFARLFGEEFARAYEEQFRQLKAQGRGRTPEQSADTRPSRK